MAVKNIKSESGKIWIPTEHNYYCKIVIKDTNNVNRTVMDSYTGNSNSNYLINGNIIKNSTDKLNSFDIKLNNPNGIWVNRFLGGEEVRIYMDVGEEPPMGGESLIFFGYIDDIKYNLDNTHGFTVDINGRDYPELTDKTSTGRFVNAKPDEALIKFLYDNFRNSNLGRIRLRFWDGETWVRATYVSDPESNLGYRVEWDSEVPTFPTTRIDMNFQHKSSWQVISEICKLSGLECYLYYSEAEQWVLRVFNTGSVLDNDSNISYGTNLINLSGFGINNSEIINRVFTYGKQEGDNITLLKTEQDFNSQNQFWVKDRVFNEPNLITMSEVESKSKFELEQGLLAVNAGRLNTVLLPYLNPGVKINAFVPFCNVNGQYVIKKIVHNLGNPTITNLEVSKLTTSFEDLFIHKINPDEFLTSLSNPNLMIDSLSIYFDEDPSMFTIKSNVEETNGVLTLSGLNTTGVAITKVIETEYNVTECELRRFENDFAEDCTFEVSNRGENAFEEYDKFSVTPHKFQSPGKKVMLKVTLNRDSSDVRKPEFRALSLLYK